MLLMGTSALSGQSKDPLKVQFPGFKKARMPRPSRGKLKQVKQEALRAVVNDSSVLVSDASREQPKIQIELDLEKLWKYVQSNHSKLISTARATEASRELNYETIFMQVEEVHSTLKKEEETFNLSRNNHFKREGNEIFETLKIANQMSTLALTGLRTNMRSSLLDANARRDGKTILEHYLFTKDVDVRIIEALLLGGANPYQVIPKNGGKLDYQRILENCADYRLVLCVLSAIALLELEENQDAFKQTMKTHWTNLTPTPIETSNLVKLTQRIGHYSESVTLDQNAKKIERLSSLLLQGESPLVNSKVELDFNYSVLNLSRVSLGALLVYKAVAIKNREIEQSKALLDIAILVLQAEMVWYAAHHVA